MVYVPREGADLNLAAGQSVFTFHSGAVYLLSGQVRYKLETEGEPFYYTLGPGSLIGLEQPHVPDGLLRASVLEPITARAWSHKSLEAYVGKDLEFALIGLLNLSQQQRRLTQELTRRLESHSAARQADGGQSGDAYFRRMVGVHPNNDVNSAIREALMQMRQEQQLSAGPLQISTAPSQLSQETQLSLYQLAFGGLDGLNQDILQRFGRAFSPGSPLCREGEAGSELFLLLKGRVDITRKGQPIGQLFEGDLVGEMSVLDGQTRTATVTALEETLTLALNREQFQMIFQLHPSWTWKLLHGFGQRLANSYRLLAEADAKAQLEQSA